MNERENPTTERSYTLMAHRSFPVNGWLLHHVEQVTLPFPPFIGLNLSQVSGLSVLGAFDVDRLYYDRDKGHFYCYPKTLDFMNINWSERRMSQPEASGLLESGTIDGCTTLEELREKFPQCIEPYPDGRVTKPVKL